MQKHNKRGFTTVELVIVIAVIAILAAVLIPTFSNLITKANESVALQECKNALTTMLTEYNGQLPEGDFYFAYNKNPDTDETVWFHLEEGKLVPTTKPEYDHTKATIWTNQYKTVNINDIPVKCSLIIGRSEFRNSTNPWLPDHIEILCVMQ